jgi:hypothetical protein
MSSARRAYDIVRSYVSHGWDQLSDSEESSAERELKAAIESPAPYSSGGPKDERREEPQITLEMARKLFDLQPNATTKQITEAYDLLRSSTDLKRFPEGSDSWNRARLLGRRLDVARNILMDNVDPTVRRFERLEIE